MADEVSLCRVAGCTGAGEDCCEGHGYSENDCNSVGCCHFDQETQQCWSSVGLQQCSGFEEEGDLATQIQESIFDWWDRMEHSQGENSPDWEDFEISLAEWESESFTAVPFTLVDLDASGKVTWDPEFLAFMDAYVQERVRVIEADTNKDGKLDPEEWAALSAADSTIPALSFFDGVVENVQDGSVNTDELVYAIIKANQLLEEDFTYEGEEEADPCISPPAWCPGSLPGLTLGSCRPFQSTTLTGDRTCNPAARWQGGIISESQNAKNTIFNLFAKAGAETLTSADVATISEQISGVAGGFATGLGSTFADIDAKGDAVVSRDELYKYLLRGGDRAGRWFTALFDKGEKERLS